jgi:hypothetical protein
MEADISKHENRHKFSEKYLDGVTKDIYKEEMPAPYSSKNAMTFSPQSRKTSTSSTKSSAKKKLPLLILKKNTNLDSSALFALATMERLPF